MPYQQKPPPIHTTLFSYKAQRWCEQIREAYIAVRVHKLRLLYLQVIKAQLKLAYKKKGNYSCISEYLTE